MREGTSAVEALQRELAESASGLSLGGGLPDETLFPRGALGRAFVAALHRPAGEALQYAWPEGQERLRAFVANRLRARGADVGPEDVIITNGAQQGLAIASQILCRAGSRVGVDPETYPAALALFRARRVLPVREEGGGAGRLAAWYKMPAMGNPRGREMDPAERARLLADRTPIIEDDAYADVRFDRRPAPRPLLADAPDRVFHVGTLSKTLCPGLRVGWLVPPARQRQRALRLKHSADLQSNSLAQAIVEEYLSRADYDAHLARIRRHYARKAGALMEAVARHLPQVRVEPPGGGFALWLQSEEALDERELLEIAVRQEGVSFDPGSEFRADGAGRPLALRLCFSALPVETFDDGVRRLARAWRKARARRVGVRVRQAGRAAARVSPVRAH
jgi:2-aminoadipate transaminase